MMRKIYGRAGTRRISRVLACLAAVLLFPGLSSCAKAGRFDCSELERRLCAVREEWSFDGRTRFMKDGEWYIYYPCGDGKMLLKAHEDDKNRLDGVSLTLLSRNGAEDKEAYFAFARALADLFVPSGAAVAEEMELDGAGELFADKMLSGEYGRYTASFFGCSAGASFILRYS